ncbi:unnamed protein product [Caenorhabditis angaria]|uniref:C2H2-type domain-containing protein n=1 Tax=Caenorhabditis angaria TaxID=860376 RepID=A0A9P1IR57_9PELO|nr:unnamed protein product [Caenorhabditis angaria]
MEEEYAYEEEYIEETVMLDPAFFEEHMLIVEEHLPDKHEHLGVSPKQRLLLYPEMRKLPVFRKLPTTQVPLILGTNTILLNTFPDLTFDAAMFIDDCPNFDREIEVSSGIEDDKSIIPVLREPKTQYSTSLADAVICEDCRICFRSRTAYLNHQNMHAQGIQSKPRVQIQCCIGECQIICDSQPTLIEHLRVQHEQLQLEFSTMNFENPQQFKEWKDDLEARTCSIFFRKWVKNLASCVSAYYFCHRSGNIPAAEKTGKPIQRSRSSKKIGTSCSAYFHMKQTKNGKITIRGCLEHVGHEIGQIDKTPLSKEIREEIAVYLLEGLDENEIVELMKDNSVAGDRRHYIQTYEVRNIYAKLERNYTPSDGKMSLADFQVKREDVETPPPYAAIEEVSTTID